jgi:hypothetical protein
MQELRLKQLVEAGVAELDAGLAVPLDMKRVKARSQAEEESLILAFVRLDDFVDSHG